MRATSSRRSRTHTTTAITTELEPPCCMSATAPHGGPVETWEEGGREEGAEVGYDGRGWSLRGRKGSQEDF